MVEDNSLLTIHYEQGFILDSLVLIVSFDNLDVSRRTIRLDLQFILHIIPSHSPAISSSVNIVVVVLAHMGCIVVRFPLWLHRELDIGVSVQSAGLLCSGAISSDELT